VPPARDILLRQPTRARDDGLVFVTKTGKRLSASGFSGYWTQVKAAAGLDFDFYHATKHYGVHQLYLLGLSGARSPRRQAGQRSPWTRCCASTGTPSSSLSPRSTRSTRACVTHPACAQRISVTQK
jgi:hypothetical protein